MRFFALLACVCVTLLASLTRALASVDSAVAWYQTYQNNTGEIPNTMTVDSAGNTITVSSYFFNLGSYWFIRKTDPYGHLLWNQSYSAFGSAQDATTDSKGNIYITGWTIENGQNETVILKYLPNGEFTWGTAFGNSQPLAIHVDAADNLYVAGVSEQTPWSTFLIKYSSSGQSLFSTAVATVSPSYAFFTAKDDLVAFGSTQDGSGPAYTVLNSSGNIKFSDYQTNPPTDLYSYVIGSDPAGNFYVCLRDHTSSTTSFHLYVFSYAGTSLYGTTSADSGNPLAVTASDPDHAYVHTQDVDYGYKTGGVRFMNVQSNADQIIADGTVGLIRVSTSSNVFTYAEINQDLQTLWQQQVPASALSTLKLKLISGNVYGLHEITLGSWSATMVAKINEGSAGLSTLTVPSTVQGTKSLPVSVQLNDVAPAGGFPINFTGNANLIGLPTQIVLAAGKNSSAFNVQTLPVDAATPVTISAEANGVIRSATVAIMPATLTSVTFPGSSVVGGQTITGTVHLSGITGLAGRAVALSSNNAHATVPSQIVVTSGNSTANFVVQTTAVSTNTQVKITATVSGGSSQSATLTISP